MGDPTEGVYVRDSTLVLQAVTRGDSGHYSCTASNTEGAASSNTILLQVKCEWSASLWLSEVSVLASSSCPSPAVLAQLSPSSCSPPAVFLQLSPSS